MLNKSLQPVVRMANMLLEQLSGVLYLALGIPECHVRELLQLLHDMRVKRVSRF